MSTYSKGSMSTLAEFSRGIPIPEAEIRSALESVAIPGYTGTLQLEINLGPEVAQHVAIAVIRRQSLKPDQAAVQKQTLPDPARKKPVQAVLDQLRSKLMIQCVVAAVEANFLDGVLQNYKVQM